MLRRHDDCEPDRGRDGRERKYSDAKCDALAVGFLVDGFHGPFGARETLTRITLEKLCFSCDARRTSYSRARIRSPTSRYFRLLESVLVESENGVLSAAP